MNTFNERILPSLETWTRFGEERNQAGTRLIGHAPHVAPRAFVNVVYAPLTNSGLEEAEQTLDRALPEQLAHILGSANGLLLFLGALRVFGCVPTKRTLPKHIHNYPPDLVVRNLAGMAGLRTTALLIGFYKNDGSYVSWEAQRGVVRFDALGHGGEIESWVDINEWLVSEVRRMSTKLAQTLPWNDISPV